MYLILQFDMIRYFNVNIMWILYGSTGIHHLKVPEDILSEVIQCGIVAVEEDEELFHI